MRLGTVLQEWCFSEGKTLRQAAHEIGINHNSLSTIERGGDCCPDTLATILVWLIRSEKENK